MEAIFYGVLMNGRHGAIFALNGRVAIERAVFNFYPAGGDGRGQTRWLVLQSLQEDNTG